MPTVFNHKVGIRSLAKMVDIYLETVGAQIPPFAPTLCLTLGGVSVVQVGRNGFLMLDFAPNQDGLINPNQVARYAEIGDWIRQCYDHPVASARFPAGSGVPATMVVTNQSPFDRVVVRENQTMGQRIRG